MFSIIFKTSYKGETVEEGFDTSFSNNIADTLDLAKEELELKQVDKIELTIIPCGI